MLYSYVDKQTGQLLSPKNCFFSYGEARARLLSAVGKHFERFAIIRPVFVDWRIVNRMTGADIYGDFSDREKAILYRERNGLHGDVVPVAKRVALEKFNDQRAETWQL